MSNEALDRILAHARRRQLARQVAGAHVAAARIGGDRAAVIASKAARRQLGADSLMPPMGASPTIERMRKAIDDVISKPGRKRLAKDLEFQLNALWQQSLNAVNRPFLRPRVEADRMNEPARLNAQFGHKGELINLTIVPGFATLSGHRPSDVSEQRFHRFVLAHEYGHAIQSMVTGPIYDRVSKETNADYLAGLTARRIGLDLVSGRRTAAALGSPLRFSHPTGIERQYWFHKGYRDAAKSAIAGRTRPHPDATRVGRPMEVRAMTTGHSPDILREPKQPYRTTRDKLIWATPAQIRSWRKEK